MAFTSKDRKTLEKLLYVIKKNSKDCVKPTDDIHFDLIPTGGVDTLGTKTGTSYTLSDLKSIIVSLGATYSQDGSAFSVNDNIVKIYIGVKPVGESAYHEGDPAQEDTSTSSMAAYQNNGAWTLISELGSREDIQFTELAPTSVDEIFVENGTAAIIRIEFQKAS